jgi:hypothetical protein
MPKVKIGYASHLLECISRRTFLEGTQEVGSALNRIADKTISELSRKGAVDKDAFNALIVFEDKIKNILKQLTAQYHNETDPEAKSNIAKIVTSSKFLSDPSQDGILKKALAGAKNAQGNRLVVFISLIIKQIVEKNDNKPIEDFKKEINHLQQAIEKFYYNDFPFQATIKPYKAHLLGPNSIIDIMDKIVDNLVQSESDISNLRTSGAIFGNGVTPGDVTHNYQTSYKYESQRAFMEAFAESLEYFARKR